MSITNERELTNAIAKAKAIGTDYDTLELKKAAHGFPESATSISALSNAHGGTIVYGIRETDFKPVDTLDVKMVQNAVASVARDDVDPEVFADVRVLDYMGKPVVVANIPEADPRRKPIHIRSKGERQGSYLRVGDGDHKLSSYEIDRLKENATGTLGYDKTIVSDAEISDLDANSLERWVAKERENDPEGTAALDRDELLLARRALMAGDDGRLHPTLAGLLCFGICPQHFFPMLRITFAQFAGDVDFDADTETFSDEAWSETRYLRKRIIEGSIPQMVSKAMHLLSATIGQSGVLVGSVMQQVPHYPLPAIREGIANALMHRDYSPAGSVTPVRIELRPHSLMIRNPGGLFGSLTEDMLGKPGGTAYRNQYLARILESVTYTERDATGTVVEALGTGYKTIFRKLREAHLPCPSVRSTLREFMLRMTDQPMQSASAQASVSKRGKLGGHTESEHSTTKQRRKRGSREAAVHAVYEYLGANGPCKSNEIAEMLGVTKIAAVRYLNQLIDEGKVERLGKPRSPHQMYQCRSSKT